MACASNLSFHHTVIPFTVATNIANYVLTAYCDTAGSQMHLLMILRSVLDEHGSTKYQISAQKKVCRIKGIVSSLLSLMSKEKLTLRAFCNHLAYFIKHYYLTYSCEVTSKASATAYSL